MRKGTDLNPEVLFEDNHLIVINKQAMIATMGAEPGTISLAEEVKLYLKKKFSKPGNVYLGIVSRLDSFVTGVIVFARTSKAAGRLAEEFRSGRASKIYWALVERNPPLEPCGELQHEIYKDDQKRRMFAVDHAPAHSKSQSARLRYKIVAECKDLRLLEIELLTGRKHQIRAQLAAMGLPIMGDRKYGSQVGFPKGIALHSRSLQIVHPTQKERMLFQANVPKYWKIDQLAIK
ncbi:MAG: RluA family pseudouridine synthase [Pirellulaceae bacterium]